MGNYKALVRENGLDEIIVFEGGMEASFLNKYYKEADIGVGVLGGYKKKMDYGSPIKGSEYCINGLPYISGHKDPRFEDEPFVYYVPNDDSVIQLKPIIEWYQNLVLDKDYKKKIVNYAFDNLTWDRILEPVVEAFKNIK